MKSQTAVAIWILLVGVAVAQAQTGIWMGAGPAPHAGAIKGAPFSADLVYSNDQINGAPGSNTMFHGKAARDSQGDSYFAMEHMMPNNAGPMRITITDPAALTITTLDPQSKSAFVSHVAPSMLSSARTLTPGASSPTPDGRPAGAVSENGTNSMTESLGTKEMNGVKVFGQRTVRSIPSTTPDGKPFVTTTETWRSPELGVIVMTQVQTSNGDRHVTRLENIVRAEPNAELFRVPAGYTVRDNAPLANNIY